MSEICNLILSEAKQWLGTPFHQQGRQKKYGCDCLGLIIGVAKSIGAKSITNQSWEVCDVQTYDCFDSSYLLPQIIPKHFPQVTSHSNVGDIILFKVTDKQYHLAIQSESNKIIHACSVFQKVIENRIPSNWLIKQVFRYNL
jgi:cell wall-associated NlpC family hydrolase